MRSRCSRTTTLHGGLTRSRLRVVSMLPRTTPTMGTRSSGCSMTPSRGGDYRSRESNVYRLAQVSNEIIDQSVAQGVPYAREYGGLLDNRSFGGAQVSRTFYARGQTGQQLLLGAYQALARQIELGTVTFHNRSEMLDIVQKDGRAVGVVIRDLVTGEGDAALCARSDAGHRRVLQCVLLVDERHGVQRNRCMEGRTARAPSSPTHPSHRSTRRAYLPRMSISQSSLSCLSRCAMTDAFGCRLPQTTTEGRMTSRG